MTDGGYIIYGAEEWTESRLERLKFHIDHYMKQSRPQCLAPLSVPDGQLGGSTERGV